MNWVSVSFLFVKWPAGFLNLHIYTPICSLLQLQDTEAVQSLVSRVEEAAMLRAAAAALWEGDEGQSTSCGSFREQQAVSLLCQLLVQQSTQQLWRDGVHAVWQQVAVCHHWFGGIRLLASGKKKHDDIKIPITQQETFMKLMSNLSTFRDNHFHTDLSGPLTF